MKLKYGERLKSDGNVESQSGFSGGEFQTDKYTLSGDGVETWEPKFSYKGFQYVEISGWPGDAPTAANIQARVVHTDMDTTSAFEASEPLFEQIHAGLVNTLLNNSHHIPTDTPAYEKNGWTGDAQLGAEMFLRNFDAHQFMAKYVRDVSESRMEDGRPALIAPDPDWRWAGFDESPTWNAAYVLIPWWLYEYTGDHRVLEENYEGILTYVRLEHSESTNHISSTSLNDYMAPGFVGDPRDDPKVAGTAYVYKMTTTAADMAEVLGHAEDAAELRAEAALIKQAFNAAYFKSDSKTYLDGGQDGYRQTQNVLPLAFGLVPEGDEQAVADGIADDIVNKRQGHLNTGVLGTKYLLPMLTRYGHGDVAYTVATQTTAPGWGAWFNSAEGATSMWESWGDYRSRNHYFLGTVDDWFFKDVVGVVPTAPGYAEAEIAPQVVGDLTSASGTTQTPFGDIVVDWKVGDDGFEMDAVVPVGVSALVRIPSGEQAVLESGIAVANAPGVEVVSRDDGETVLRVGSGSYRFTLGDEAAPDPEVAFTSAAEPRCVANKALLGVRVTNDEAVPVSFEFRTQFGTKAFASVAPGKNATHSFTTRLGSLPAGTVEIVATAEIDGQTVTTTRTVEHVAAPCTT